MFGSWYFIEKLKDKVMDDTKLHFSSFIFENFSNYFLQNCHDHENIIEQIIESDKWNSM